MKLTTVVEGAEILGTTVQRAYELVRLQILPPGVVVRLGRQVRINKEALEDWIREGGQSLPGGWRRQPTDPRSNASMVHPNPSPRQPTPQLAQPGRKNQRR